jgi:hypothetical protein
MTKIFTEILDKKRHSIFQTLRQVDEKAFLIGGTAIALQIKHRKSVDFDMALDKPIHPALLRKVNTVFEGHSITVSIDQPSELTVILDNNVKITFLHYPFVNLHPLVKTDYLNLASLKDLASTKAQTIGRRGEWKDYVDIYFLLTKVSLDIERIIQEAKRRFAGEFSEKLFWEQLVYWDDIANFEIDYINGDIDKSTIQNFFSHLTKKRFESFTTQPRK